MSLVPFPRYRCAGGVYGTDPCIQQGLDGGVRMGCGAAVMRIVNDGGDACINAAQCRQQVADIHIGRAIVLGEREVRGVAVVFQTSGIRIDAAQLSLPGVAMRIHHPRHGDHVRSIDDTGTIRLQILAYGRNG